MSKYVCLFLSVLMLLCVSSSAQNISVTSAANSLRGGDCLQRHLLTDFADGDGGDGKVWSYTDANISDQEHTVEYYMLGDTIVESALGTRYFYRQSGDTLYLLGFDNRTSHFAYSRPLPVLRYPCALGDTVSCTFTGSGIYGDHLRIGTAGRCHTTADACGMIVCGEDTLTDVLRVHHHRETVRRAGYGAIPAIGTDSLDLYVSNAAGAVTEDIYYYYKPGYRYPVITSVSSSSLRNGQRLPHTGYAALCTASQQEYDIHYDPENERARSYSAANGSMQSGGSPGMPDNSNVFGDITATNDGSNVYVRYAIPTSLPVTFTVYDALSRQMSATYTVSDTGDITLPLLYSTRSVLLLHVTCGDSSTVLKVPVNH